MNVTLNMQPAFSPHLVRQCECCHPGTALMYVGLEVVDSGRFVAAYCAAQKSRPRPRPVGLDSYLEDNQKRGRR